MICAYDSRMRLPTIFAATLFVATLFVASTFLGCPKPKTPADDSAEAGAPLSGGSRCENLQGATDSGAVLIVCLTVEEIAYVVSLLVPMLGLSADAGACTIVPTTTVCAPPLAIGRALSKVLDQRRGRLMRDAGTPDAR